MIGKIYQKSSEDLKSKISDLISPQICYRPQFRKLLLILANLSLIVNNFFSGGQFTKTVFRPWREIPRCCFVCQRLQSVAGQKLFWKAGLVISNWHSIMLNSSVSCLTRLNELQYCRFCPILRYICVCISCEYCDLTFYSLFLFIFYCYFRIVTFLIFIPMIYALMCHFHYKQIAL